MEVDCCVPNRPRCGWREDDGVGERSPVKLQDPSGFAEKSLYWIEGTDRRFDGYNSFGAPPEIPVEWFDKHVI